MKKTLLAVLSLFWWLLLAVNFSFAQEVDSEEITNENTLSQKASVDNNDTINLWDYQIWDSKWVPAAWTSVPAAVDEWIYGWMLGASWIIMLVTLLFVILIFVGLWKICKKAWRKGWEGILPIYNLFVLWDIAGLRKYVWAPAAAILLAFAWWFLTGSNIPYIDTLVDLFSFGVNIVLNYNLARKFWWWVFGGIMCVIFSGICYIVLGCWGSQYQGEQEEQKLW